MSMFHKKYICKAARYQNIIALTKSLVADIGDLAKCDEVYTRVSLLKLSILSKRHTMLRLSYSFRFPHSLPLI